jgi:hypothetical protein
MTVWKGARVNGLGKGRERRRKEGYKIHHGALDLRDWVADRLSRVGEAALTVLDHEALAGRDVAVA